MRYDFVPLILLLLVSVPLWFLKRWITQHLQGLGFLIWGNSDMAMVLYFLALLPGIVIHELSHWLFAKGLGVRTGRLTIWPSYRRSGRIRLGSLQVAKTDPVRGSLIGLAPLLTGSLTIFLIGGWVLGVTPSIDALFAADWGSFLASLKSTSQAPDFWIWLYVIFAVSNTMFPSRADRRGWLQALGLVAAVALLFSLVGVDTYVPQKVIGLLFRLIRYLTYAFALTVAVDIVFACVIAVLEKITGHLKGERVEYGGLGS